MIKQQTAAEQTFMPQSFKCFESALNAFLAQQCPQLGGSLTRQTLVQSIRTMVHQFFPDTSYLKPGQTLWPTVHKDEKSSYGKSITNTQLIPVMLDLVQPQDSLERAQGKKLRLIKKEAVARLCQQAYQQNGCLTQAEIAILLKLAPATVGHYIAEWELEHQTVLPRRGSIHDMGPTLTHKKIIIHKLFILHKSVQQTSRETNHSPQAIQRYIAAFRQVLLCRQKGMTTTEIAFATGFTARLVQQYQLIIDHYQQQGYNIPDLLQQEPYIENNIELWNMNNAVKPQ